MSRYHTFGLTHVFRAEYIVSVESVLTPAAAFAKAVRLAGGQTSAALLLGIQQPAVSKRLKKNKPANPEEVLTLEASTGVSRFALRPDIYGAGPSIESATVASGEVEPAR